MSITNLLLLFICISLHACNARHLSTLDHNKLENKSQFSHVKIIDDKKNGIDSSPKQLNEVKNKMKTTSLLDDAHDDSVKPENPTSTTKHSVVKAVMNVKDSGALLQTESVASVSMRVPRNKKPSEKNPGFNLDYSPPKTHPPSNN